MKWGGIVIIARKDRPTFGELGCLSVSVMAIFALLKALGWL